MNFILQCYRNLIYYNYMFQDLTLCRCRTPRAQPFGTPIMFNLKTVWILDIWNIYWNQCHLNNFISCTSLNASWIANWHLPLLNVLSLKANWIYNILDAYYIWSEDRSLCRNILHFLAYCTVTAQGLHTAYSQVASVCILCTLLLVIFAVYRSKNLMTLYIWLIVCK